MVRRVTHPRFLAAASSAFLALVLAACGSSSTASSAPLDPSVVAFRVRSRAGFPLPSATVYLVPVAAVDTTPITDSDVRDGSAEDRDEPLEDAVRLHGASFPKGVTDPSGWTVIGDVPPGRYYWLTLPAPADLEHLPGGTDARFAREHTTFLGRSFELVLSSRPSPTAGYLGSSVCIDCHGDQIDAAQHAHHVGLSRPDVFSALQDPARYPDIADGWDPFVDAAVPTGGTALWLTDHDPLGDPAFKVSLADPASRGETAQLRAWLWRDTGDAKHKVTLENLLDAGDPLLTLEVPLGYGGAVYRQLYLARLPGRKGLYPLLQYQTEGDDARFDASRRTFRDVRMGSFFDAGLQKLTLPPPQATFEADCAGCHFTGLSLFDDGGTLERLGTAVPDPGGAFDIDDNGMPNEVNIGCESCHGPGTDHGTWAANPANAARAARYIVSPTHLSPSRQLLLCGRCHDRVVGAGSLPGEAPLNAADRMPLPGISRPAYLAQHVTEKGPAADDLWVDGRHPFTIHQQYADLLKSPKHHNDRILVVCSDCHTLHGEGPFEHHLVADPADPESQLCARCHLFDPIDHMVEKTGVAMAGLSTRCTDCHMTETAQGGAGRLGVTIGPVTGGPSDPDVTYWRGDLATHQFLRVPRKTDPGVAGVRPGDAMPIPFTNACGAGCHSASLIPTTPPIPLLQQLLEGGR